METTRMYDSDRLICVASLTGVRGWKYKSLIACVNHIVVASLARCVDGNQNVY